MANVSKNFGFRPTRTLLGSAEWNGQMNIYGFSVSDANNAFIGDVVSFDSTYRATALTDKYVPLVPLVTPATGSVTTNVIRGVICGFPAAPEFNTDADKSLGLRYRKASTAGYCWVVDDYNTIFTAQEAGNSYTSASSNAVNKCMDISYTAGSLLTGLSGVQLSGTATVSGVKPFRILRLNQRVDNFGFAATDTNSYAKYDVMIANSDLAQANVGV